MQNHYFGGKCSGNHHLKMHLTPHMYKIVTLKANAKEIITWKCFWCQICTKCYCKGKCSENRHFNMHLAPNMYKIVTLKANLPPPPVSHFHNNYSLHFSDFQFYQVTLTIDPPKNGNFILLLTCSGQEWQFHMTSDILWSKMAISYVYWHLVAKNGNCTCLQTFSGHKW